MANISGYDGLWEDTDEAKKGDGGSFDKVPPGDYTFIVHSFLQKTVNGKKCLELCAKVLEGPHLDKRINTLYWFNEKSFAFLKKDLATLGVSLPAKLSDWETEEIEDRGFMGRVAKDKTGKYTNLYINEGIGPRDDNGDEDGLF